MINMIKTIDTIFGNRVNLSKQASKQASYCMQKYQEGGFKLRTRIPLFRMWGDWYYLVSVTCDVYA